MTDTLIHRTESAYDYPLLIKNLLVSSLANNADQEIVYRGQLRYSYETLGERIRRLADTLTRLGVKPGDTVAVMDWDSHRYLECFFAVPMLGAVLHTINIRLSPEQILYTIDHAEDDVLLVNSEFLPIMEQIKGRIDTVKQYILLTDEPAAPVTQITFAGEYEAQTGVAIVECLRARGIDPVHMPAVLVANHGPFAWGADAAAAVHNAAVLEVVARMAFLSMQMDPALPAMPQQLLEKHFLRKHGPGAYYGQIKV